MATQKLQILVTLKDAASKGLGKMTQALKGLRSGVGNVLNPLAGLQGLLAGLSVALLARSFVSAADAAEQYRVRLAVLLGSQEKANQLFKEMSDFASTVSYEYKDVMSSATQLAGVMQGGNKEIKEWMPLITDLAAASGLGIEEATGQIIRMYSAGAASADLFRERGILAMLGFQAGVSYTADETRKKLIEAYEDPHSKFKGAATELAKTWSGMLSMVADRWFQFRNMVMEGGVFDYIKTALQMWLDYLDKLKNEGKLDAWAKDMAQKVVKALGGIATVVAWLADAFRGWKMIWEGLKLAFYGLTDFMILGLMGVQKAVSVVVDGFLGILAFLQAVQERAKELADNMAQHMGAIPGIGKGMAASAELFSKALEKSISTTDKIKTKFAAFGDYVKKGGETLSDMDQHMLGLLQKTTANLKAVANEVPYHTRVKGLLKEIEATVSAINDKRKEGSKIDDFQSGAAAAALKDKALYDEQIAKQSVERLKAATATALQELEQQYKLAGGAVESYFNGRKENIIALYEASIEELKRLKAEAATPEKKAEVDLKIYEAEQQHLRDLSKLEFDRVEAIKARAQEEIKAADILAEAAKRASSGTGFALQDTFNAEESDMLAKQKAEQEAYLLLVQEGYAQEEGLNKLKNDHLLEQEKLHQEQKKRLQEFYLTTVSTTLGNAASSFKDFYEATGKQHKEAFALYKAFSVAEAIIQTYQGATSAFTSLSSIPYVGPALGAVAAAAAIASGMAKVAMIRQQTFARGGKVEGISPHPKADNIPVWATAGEFVHPVNIVQKYGLGVMEKIRRGEISATALQRLAQYPNDLAGGFKMATGGQVARIAAINKAASTSNVQRFADGGLVSASAANQASDPTNNTPSGGTPTEITITNIVDPTMVRQYLNSKEGGDAIINVIGSRSGEVKKRLA